MAERKRKQTLYLGIDTGGTYTDAVILNAADSSILCSSKALTTRHDLAVGLRNAMEGVLGALPEHITLMVLILDGYCNLETPAISAPA